MDRLLILAFVSVIAVGGCSRSPEESASTQGHSSAKPEYEEGAAQARADLKADRPRYLRVGPPPSADSRFAVILNEDYGITLVELGCTGGGDRVNGYNEAVLEAMQERFGIDVIQVAWQKDQEQRKQRTAGTEGTNKRIEADQ